MLILCFINNIHITYSNAKMQSKLYLNQFLAQQFLHS